MQVHSAMQVYHPKVVPSLSLSQSLHVIQSILLKMNSKKPPDSVHYVWGSLYMIHSSKVQSTVMHMPKNTWKKPFGNATFPLPMNTVIELNVHPDK